MPVVTIKLPYPEFSTSGYRVVRTPYFSIKTRPNGLMGDRIGVVVGANTMKRAVDRNFWKRQIKTTLQNRKGGGTDVLVIFFKKPLRSEKNKVKEELLCHISTN